MTGFLASALGYARLGWPVFPLSPPGNAPAIPSAHPEGDPLRGVCHGECGREGHGFYEASCDLERIETWWAEHTRANIGCRTGIAFDVLDVDNIDFATGVADLSVHGDVHPTARSGGGKWHVFFRPTGVGRRIRFSECCDWLGTNGYVVLPPSTHRSGGTYSWVTPPPFDLPAAPPELLEAVRTRNGRAVQRVPIGTRLPTTHSSWSPAGLLRMMETAVEGNRNATLYWCAHRITDDLRAGKVTSSAAAAALEALDAGAHGVGLTDHEICATIRSALRGTS